jgi:type II secretory pathway component PulF
MMNHVLQSLLTSLILRFGFGVNARIRMYESLALLLDTGSKLSDALSDLRVAAETQRRLLPFTAQTLVLDECINSLRGGRKLSDGLAPYVSVQEITLIAAGEETGGMIAALERLIVSLDQQQALKATLKIAFAQPVMIFVATIAALTFIGFSVVPELLRLQEASAYSADTQRLIAMGEFVLHDGIYCAIALVAFIGWVLWALPNLRGSIRDRIDEWPLFKIYKIFMGSTFMGNTAVMLSSGISLARTLESMSAHANPYLRERIDNTIKGVRRGETLGDALLHAEHHFPDRETIAFIRPLASREGFANSLDRFTSRWLKSNVKRIETAAGALSTIALVLAGYVVLTIVMGVLGISGENK